MFYLAYKDATGLIHVEEFETECELMDFRKSHIAGLATVDMRMGQTSDEAVRNLRGVPRYADPCQVCIVTEMANSYSTHIMMQDETAIKQNPK